MPMGQALLVDPETTPSPVRHRFTRSPRVARGAGSAADGLDASLFSADEDSLDRWRSVALVGGLLLAPALVTLECAIQPTRTVQLTTLLMAGGGMELVLGTFLAYIAFPGSIVPVAVAGVLTLGVGGWVATETGEAVAITGVVCAVLGGIALCVGTVGALFAWQRTRRES
jgi:hypothetical protein